MASLSEAISTNSKSQPIESNSNQSEEKCAVCLSSIEQPAFPDGCFHSFCFVCLREWTLARVPAQCPLCKTQIRVIHYNVRSPDSFQSFIVSSSRNSRSASSDPPPPPPMPTISILSGIPRYDPNTGFFGLPVVTTSASTSSRNLAVAAAAASNAPSREAPIDLTEDSIGADDNSALAAARARGLGPMSEALQRAHDRFEEILQSTRDTVMRARETRQRLVRLGISRSRADEAAECRRKLVYQLGVRAAPVETSSDRVRLISPGFWANNEAQTHRLVPWLTRELRLLLRLLSPKLSGTERLNERVAAAVRHLLELIKRVEFHSPEFRAAVASLVGNARSDHFIYEFENFARSPYHMGEYDAKVQYPPAERQLPHALVPSSPVSLSSSSSLSSSLSSLEIHDNISISSSVSIVGEEPRRTSTIDLDTDSDVEVQLAVSSLAPTAPATDVTAVSARSNPIAFTFSTQPATNASRPSSSSTFYSIDSDGVVSASAHHPASPTASNAFSTATTLRTGTDLSSSSVREVFAAPSLLEQLLLSPQESRSTLTRRHLTHSRDSLDSDVERRSRRRHRDSAHPRLTSRDDWSRSRSRSSSRSPDPRRHSSHTAESSARPTRASLLQQSTSSSSNHRTDTSTAGIAERSRERSHRQQQHRSSSARYRSRSLRSASASSSGSVEVVGRSAARLREATRDGERDRSRSRSRHRASRHRSRRQRHVRAQSSSASRRSPSPRPRPHVRERSHDRSRRHHLVHLPLRRDWFLGCLPRRGRPSSSDVVIDDDAQHGSSRTSTMFACGSSAHRDHRLSDVNKRSRSRSRSPPHMRTFPIDNRRP